MPLSDAAVFIFEHVLPQAIDVEAAKGIILKYMSEQPRTSATPVGFLISAVRSRLATTPGPTPPGYISIDPDVHVLRAELAAREAIQLLHGQGALVAHGQFTTSSGPDVRAVIGVTSNSRGPVPDVSIAIPEVQHSYSLATAYLGDRFLLADGDVYLSQLDKGRLPSRVRRCLKEAVSTFQHGDYLSAALNLGAASESLWLRLARGVLVRAYQDGSKLADELSKPYPSIGVLIDATWKLLESHADGELKRVFPTKGDRAALMQQVGVLRDRRNYAIHDDEADEDEALLRYNETGILLLASIAYFNELIALVETIATSATQP